MTYVDMSVVLAHGPTSMQGLSDVRLATYDARMARVAEARGIALEQIQFHAPA